MLRLIFLIPALVFFAPLLVVAVSTLLVFNGSPGQCGGGRDISADPQIAFTYDQRWLAFNGQLINGLPATLNVTENEATSRADLFLAQANAPIDDLRVCMVDGGADINGKIDTPLGPDIEVRVKGSADLSGQHPDANIDSIRIGAMPAFVTRPFHGLVSRVIDREMNRIQLDHRLDVEIREGETTITGTP